MNDRPDHDVQCSDAPASALASLDPTLFMHALTEQSSLVIYVTLLDPPRVVYISSAYERIWGGSREEALRDPGVWMRFIHEEDRQRVEDAIHTIWQDGQPFDLEYRIVRADGCVRNLRDRMIAGGREHGFIIGVGEDITEAHRDRALLFAQRRCLEDIARGEPLESSLGGLTHSIETLTDGSRASILLLNPVTRCVQHLAAPSMPEGYIRVIDGLPIGPVAGSCGTAMHRGSRVIVTDIETDPLWAPFRALASEHGLVACWSEPILARDGRVLGSFALYPEKRRGPTDDERDLLTAAARLASIAIERDESTRVLEARVRDRTGELRVANQRLVNEADECRRMMEALTASEDRFRSMVQRVPGAVYRCAMDSDWTMKFLSVGAEPITGRPATDFIDSAKCAWASVIHPDDRAAVERAVIEAVTKREPFTLEYRVIHRDGRVRWVYEQGRATFDGARVQWLDGVILDVTSEHEMREALRESEHRFRILADDAPMLIWMTDAEGVGEFCSRAWRDRTGRSADPAPHNEWMDRFSDADRARLRACLRTDVASPKPFELECPIRVDQGEDRIFLVRGAPRTDGTAGTALRGYVGTATDITDLRRAQDAARTHEAELARMLRLASIGEMASALAHELNQPLAAISNFASGAALRMRSEALSAKDLAHVLEEIDSLARRGGSIIHRVRGLIRARTPHGGVADPAESIRRAWRMVESEASRIGVRMTLELDGAPPTVCIDPVQLEQVVINLARNAIEELAECPHQRRDLIMRAAAIPLGGGYLEVLDTGRGLSVDDGALFEPFVTSKPTGMGLGLAISRSIIESAGGRLLWSPNRPHGSRFRIELPERPASRTGAAP